tara:strand:- start:4975 stop:5355 length:381 start_codon:yes stop_codon:yes gene_type:complete
MSYLDELDVIHVRDVNLWAHVGVLPKERELGQKFLLDFSLWFDLGDAAKNDDLSSTADYSLAIKKIQTLALEISCMTIETFSEQILDLLEDLYGKVPVRILLKKCNPPVDGFFGTVSVERNRYFHP